MTYNELMVSHPLPKSDWIEEALTRYERPLIRRALQITGDIELARDVVQDTFLKLCKTEREKITGNLAAWLFTVCRNRALDVLKKEGRMGPLKDVDALKDLRRGPEKSVSDQEATAIVREVLAAVSDQHREAFLLKFEDQLTYREISQVMGKSLGTVSKLITTTIMAIRDRMARGDKLARSMR